MLIVSQILSQAARHNIKRRLVKLTTPWHRLVGEAQLAYGQEGEDLVVARLFGLSELFWTGFYVDVGAHHPSIYSNTRYFYDRGWSGINIDAAPNSMVPFNLERPKDINLEIALSDAEQELDFFEFEGSPQLNGFDAPLAQKRLESGNRLKSKTKIKTQTLAQALDSNLPQDGRISFLSVDVEGLDLTVLRSNNWKKYRPALVLVEDSNAYTLEEALNSEIGRFMCEISYIPVAKTALTVFYADAPCIEKGIYGVRVRPR